MTDKEIKQMQYRCSAENFRKEEGYNNLETW